jgi:hypothetical protein
MSCCDNYCPCCGKTKHFSPPSYPGWFTQWCGYEFIPPNSPNHVGVGQTTTTGTNSGTWDAFGRYPK